ncbi:MAG: GTP-binding protein, partial [Pseudomonadota bacterium]
MKIRNLAIIAHVDHGKTTLIDGLFKQAGVFKSYQNVEERVMDSGELEKERGITIRAKNASFDWKGVNINIVDTPGHSDFGGEVERALFMVDGALLLVDASEGPLPQTRFVLRKAFEKNLKIIVIINKVDRQDSRIEEVEAKILDLFCDLATKDHHIEYRTFYGSSKQGWASSDKNKKTEDFAELLDAIVKEFLAPNVDVNGPFSMIVTNRTYSNFLGHIAVGRIQSGRVKVGERVAIIGENNIPNIFPVTALEKYSGLKTERFEELEAGCIALLAGAEMPMIGDTICSAENPVALPRIHVDPPTVAVRVSVNTSPFAGTEGIYLTTNKLEELLEKVCHGNVSIIMERTQSPEVFVIKARGELQVVIILEEIRRQGYELMVACPQVIPFEKNGELFEPEETFVIDIPEEMVGTVTELLSRRNGFMTVMENLHGSPRVRLEFVIPTRGLFGIRSELLTATRGEAVFSSSFHKYIPFQGKRFSRTNGALVSDRDGVSVQYGLFHLHARGRLFVKEGSKIYEGMIFGENNRANDINANPTKTKKLTNMRSVTSDDSTKLNPIKEMDLDEALAWIDENEWVEITPNTIRLRKAELRTNMRNLIRSND